MCRKKATNLYEDRTLPPVSAEKKTYKSEGGTKTFFFFLRDTIFKKTLFEKLQKLNLC